MIAKAAPHPTEKGSHIIYAQSGRPIVASYNHAGYMGWDLPGGHRGLQRRLVDRPLLRLEAGSSSPSVV
jgi:hypothetical protein